MELHLTKNSISNTSLVDTSGRTLYTIDTPTRLMHQTTTVSRLSPSGAQAIAQIEWHSFHHTKMMYGGQTYDFDEFMKNKWSKSDRVFSGPDGRAYTWKCHGSKEELLSDIGQILAWYESKNAFKGRMPTLYIDGSAMHMIDIVVLTWIYVERERRDNNAASTSAATAASTSAAC